MFVVRWPAWGLKGAVVVPVPGPKGMGLGHRAVDRYRWRVACVKRLSGWWATVLFGAWGRKTLLLVCSLVFAGAGRCWSPGSTGKLCV